MSAKVPPPRDDVNMLLQEVLADLLDHYPGVLILVREEDGSARVTAGSSSFNRGDDINEYKELIRCAPDIIEMWVEEQTRLVSEEELN